MKVGMLWFDGKDVDDVRPRVQAAASYYQSKYGRAPTVCFLHPSMMAGLRGKTGTLVVRALWPVGLKCRR